MNPSPHKGGSCYAAEVPARAQGTVPGVFQEGVTEGQGNKEIEDIYKRVNKRIQSSDLTHELCSYYKGDVNALFNLSEEGLPNPLERTGW